MAVISNYLIYFLLISLVVSMVRVVIGPSVADRMIGFNLMGAQILSLLVLLSVAAEKSIYLDVALVYDIFGFVGILAITRYFGGKEGGTMTIAAYVFFGLGVLFNLIGNIGVLMFPDVYTRLQASSTCGTTSVLSFLIGSMLLADWGPMTGRLLVITLFFFVTNPISSHIIARFAWLNGMVPWRKSYGRHGTMDISND